MMSRMKLGSVAALSVTMVISACATTGSGAPLTAQQRIVRCGAIVAGGALLGGVVGNNVGDGNAGSGALIGAALGGGACAVWLAFENEKDKRRLMEAQLMAARQGEAVTDSWTGDDGRVRTVTIAPSTETQMVLANTREADGPAVARICRPMNTTVAVGGQSQSMSEVYCRTDEGDWEPAGSAMVPAV